MRSAHFIPRHPVFSALVLAICGFFSPARAGETEPFDLKNPPQPEPGKTYRLIIEPGKQAKPVELLFIAEKDPAAGGALASIVQTGQGELPFVPEPGMVRVDVEDYDADGYLDFRMPESSGTGGTSYIYFRYDRRKYVIWEEPVKLGINHIDPKTKTASASWRSGPAYRCTNYRIVGGHFVLSSREVYDQAENVRKLVPKEIRDGDYVLIQEDIKGGKVVKRSVTKNNPWESEPPEK